MLNPGDPGYDEAQQRAIAERAVGELKTHEGKNLLERYALYMLRVQMYELALKQDLREQFGVAEDRADCMNLSSIFRYYVDHDIRAHPVLYANIRDIARQRNAVAHEFLATAGASVEIAGDQVMQLFAGDLAKWVWELELAFQQYVQLRESKELYKDWGVKPAI